MARKTRVLMAYKTKKEFFRLQSRMSRRARAKKILTEKDVERLVFEGRRKGVLQPPAPECRAPAAPVVTSSTTSPTPASA